MRCVVPARSLRNRLAAVAAVIPRRVLKPLLGTIRLEVDEQGGGTLIATDLETWVRIKAPPLRNTESGVAQLPPRALATLLGAAGHRDVQLESDPEAFALAAGPDEPPCRLIVTSPRARSVLRTYRPEDFPVREEEEPPGYHELEQRQLVRLIRTTAFAADPGCTRYQLGGCWFGLGADAIDVVATDGYRLAHAWTGGVRVLSTPDPPAIHAPGDRSRVLAPVVGARALGILVRLLDELRHPSERIALAWTADGFLRAWSAELSFASRQRAGRFPAWHDAIPPASPHRAHLVRSDHLLSALKQASALADRGRPAVRLELRPGRMTLSAKAAATGVTRFEVDCDSRSEPAHADFNPMQLIEPLEIVAGEAVDLELNGPGGTAVLHATGLNYYVRALDADDTDDAGTGREPVSAPRNCPARALAAEPRNETN
jgi:DNA polymerase-3 subunit beta